MKCPLLLSLTTACAFISPLAAEERRGDNPDARPLTPQEQLARFKVPPGFEVQLVASEPEIHKPLNINFDAAGRIWTTGSELYPWAAAKDANGQPVPGFEKMYQEAANAFAGGNPPAAEAAGKDTVRVLSDFGPDGRARKIEVFADGLNIPTGIQPLSRRADAKGDSVIVYSIPNIWRFEDTDGDGKADKREPLYEGFGFVDTHGMSSNYIHWIDGWIYGCHGFRNHSIVKDRSGNVTEFQSGNTYRFRPDGSKIEYWSHGQTNPFGLAFDAHGNLYSADSHSKPVYMVLPGGFYEGIGKEHDGLGFAPRITDDDHGSSAIAGIAYVSDERWPQEFQGNLFNGNPVTQRVNRASLKWHGSTPKATREADFLSCDDPWFRPVQVKLGPDGALYIADFYNPIIGHYEVPLTDPRRDRKHGRIWRVVWKGEAAASAAQALPDLTKLDAEALVRQLGAPNIELQRLAANELVARLESSAQVRQTPLGSALSAAWDKGNPVARKNALWAVSRLEKREAAGTINADDLAVEVRSSDPLLQAQIIRYLTEQESIAGEAAERLNGAMEAAAKGDPHVARAWCRFVAERPTQAGFSSLLRAAETGAGDAEDKELIYARRIALRDVLKSPQGFEWAAQVGASPKAAEIIGDVAVGVPGPAAAEFLLAHLQRTNFSNGRAGDQLKHIAMHAAPERLPQVVELLEKSSDTRGARLAFADGLFDAARKRGLQLPEATFAWVQSTLVEALGSKDEGTIKRALQAVRDAKTEAKLEPALRDSARCRAPRAAPRCRTGCAWKSPVGHAGARQSTRRSRRCAPQTRGRSTRSADDGSDSGEDDYRLGHCAAGTRHRYCRRAREERRRCGAAAGSHRDRTRFSGVAPQSISLGCSRSTPAGAESSRRGSYCRSAAGRRAARQSHRGAAGGICQSAAGSRPRRRAFPAAMRRLPQGEERRRQHRAKPRRRQRAWGAPAHRGYPRSKSQRRSCFPPDDH
jgi:glucose/arabinose dehydrogenase